MHHFLLHKKNCIPLFKYIYSKNSYEIRILDSECVNWSLREQKDTDFFKQVFFSLVCLNNNNGTVSLTNIIILFKLLSHKPGIFPDNEGLQTLKTKEDLFKNT